MGQQESRFRKQKKGKSPNNIDPASNMDLSAILGNSESFGAGSTSLVSEGTYLDLLKTSKAVRASIFNKPMQKSRLLSLPKEILLSIFE